MMAGGLKCTVSKLLGGPYDGCETLCSHGNAWHEGEFYCHVEMSGDEPDVLRHEKTWLAANTPGGDEQIAAERKKVEAWMQASHDSVMKGGLPVPMATLIPMSPIRIGVHYSMVRCGAE